MLIQQSSIGAELPAHAQQPPSSFAQDSPNLDLLRAFAVLSVLGAHLLLAAAPNGVPGFGHLSSIGTFGVLIFFVHTSLVLMLSLERMRQRDGKTHIAAFYLRRAFRIYPLAIITVLLAVILGYCTLTAPEIWANLALVMNFTQSPLAILPLWSLPYEMDMYVVLPFLFIFAQRFRSAWAVFALMPLCGIAALLQPVWLPRFDVIEYVGCFLPGIMAYQLSKGRRPTWPPLLWPMLLVTLTIVYSGLAALHLRPAFPLRWTVCLILGWTAPRFQAIPYKLIRQWAGVVAKYSYGIYLLHTFSLHIAFVSLAGFHVLIRWAIFLVTIVLFPFVAYHTIEQPGIDFGKWLLAHFTASQGPPALGYAGRDLPAGPVSDQ
jgi:peptidoglycan/LPS O-acetylase OafA/YrhL